MKRCLSLLIVFILLTGTACAVDCARFSFDGIFLPEGSEPILMANGYQSANVNIQVETVYNTEIKADVTVADIYVRSLENLRRDFGNDTWGKGSLSVKKFAKKTGSPLVMSGDSGAAIKQGLVVGNGKVWRNTHSNKRDVAVIWKNGIMECFTADAMINEGIYERTDEIWQTFLFGPMLLKRDGSVFNDRKEFSYDDVFIANPRAVIGYVEPGHYMLVLVAGRKTKSVVESKKKNYGADLCEMSQIMSDLGCQSAYNLDGGQSAVMWFGESIVTATINNGRPVGDAIIVCEPPEK